MNKYQEALNKINYPGDKANGKKWLLENEEPETYLIFKELVDKATPKKPILNTNIIHDYRWNPMLCPICNREVGNKHITKGFIVLDKHDHCSKCGQALDWSNE